MKKLGLYIHIPFCVRKCNYCDFFSVSNCDAEALNKYTDVLCTNIKLWQNELNDYVIDTIYFGGGTPSLLSTSNIYKILDCINSNFRISDTSEITIEGNPNSLIKLELGILKEYGINRISMGLQSINDDELKLLGRLHDAVDAKVAINTIYKSGIDNFSLDVMLGIPLQNSSTLANTLDFCIKSGAMHISTYMLKIEKNTAFFNNKESYVFPDNDTMADLYEQTCETLKANGFRHYEVSNFCKNDLISKHNMKYWMLDDYLGVGPSAHSLIKGKRFYYPRDFDKFSTNTYFFESEGNTAEEYIMLTLRTDSGFRFSDFKEKFSADISSEFIDKCKLYQKVGFLQMNEDGIVLTDKGFLVSNTIINELTDTLV